MRKTLLIIAVITVLGASSHAAVRSYIWKNFFPAGEEFLCPIKGNNLKLRYDAYGEGHFGANRKNGRSHQGIDILASSGTPVRAARSGWAAERYDKEGYGNYVTIYHRDGYSSRYCHLEAANMRWGQLVKKGDVIGWVGVSGNARAPGLRSHLHFEIRNNGVPVHPGLCLKERIRK